MERVLRQEIHPQLLRAQATSKSKDALYFLFFLVHMFLLLVLVLLVLVLLVLVLVLLAPCFLSVPVSSRLRCPQSPKFRNLSKTLVHAFILST